jgi:hypothetical protein
MNNSRNFKLIKNQYISKGNNKITELRTIFQRESQIIDMVNKLIEQECRTASVV